MTTTAHPGPPPSRDPATPAHASLTELSSRISQDLSTLVNQELELAKLELAQAGRRAGLGAALASGAGLLGLTAWLLVAFGLAELLHTEAKLSLWSSALLVAAGYLLLAAGLGLAAAARLKGVSGPRRSIAAAKATIAALKARAPGA